MALWLLESLSRVRHTPKPAALKPQLVMKTKGRDIYIFIYYELRVSRERRIGFERAVARVLGSPHENRHKATRELRLITRLPAG